MFSNEEMKHIIDNFDESKKIAVDSGFTPNHLDEIEWQYQNFELDCKYRNREERRRALKLKKRMNRKRKI